MSDDMPLEARIQRLETLVTEQGDRLEILNLMAAYGPAIDACSEADNARLWTEDCVYEVGGLGSYHGHAGLKEMIEGPFHQQVTASGSAHDMGLPFITLKGDQAVATSYAKLLRQTDGRFELVRLVVSRWLLRKEGGVWKVAHRTNHLLNGSAESRALQSGAFHFPELAGASD